MTHYCYFQLRRMVHDHPREDERRPNHSAGTAFQYLWWRAASTDVVTLVQAKVWQRVGGPTIEMAHLIERSGG